MYRVHLLKIRSDEAVILRSRASTATPPQMPHPLNPDQAKTLMQIALAEAQRASELNEVPVGAVLVNEAGQILSKAHNLVETDRDPTAHAEILVIKNAAKTNDEWRLNNCTLVVTLEPCSMCIGAIRLARVSTVIYGAKDPRLGACGSLYDLSQDPRWGLPIPRVIPGILEPQCSAVLGDFFAKLR